MEIWKKQLTSYVKKELHQQRKKQIVLLLKVLTSVVVDGNDAVILEVNAETDFVAKNEAFQTLVKELGEHLIKQLNLQLLKKH